MLEFFADNFSDFVFLAIMLVALIPTLESKVAIPFGLAVEIWGENTLPPALVVLFAFLGSMLPSLLIMWIARKIKNRTSGFVCEKFLTKFQNRNQKKLDKIGASGSLFKKCLLLATFVAVPLPLTGVYTGSFIAGLTNLKYWQAFVSICVGELISCLVVFLLCSIFENSVMLVLLISVVLCVACVIISLLVDLLKFYQNKKKKVIEKKQEK